MLPKFATQKNPGLESFKPKKILLSSLSLEIRSAPPAWAIHYKLHLVPDIDDIFCRISIVSVPPLFNQPILFELQPTLSMSRRKAREAYLINRG